ncbi:penicillin-binding protein 2 [Candidatus Berkelbacteria bacterium]|nr:penicillin-binding protein 2 [Candidatus Berkelbacteria bacterium]
MFNFFKKFSKRINNSETGIFDPYIPIKLNKKIDQLEVEWVEPSFSEEHFSDIKPHKERHIPLKTLSVIFALVLISRLLTLQITHGQEYQAKSENNRLKAVKIVPPRGLIYDSSGQSLVKNTPSYSVIVQPQELPKDEGARNELLLKLSKIINVSHQELINTVNEARKNKHSETVVAEGIDREKSMALELKLNNFSGVSLEKSPIRLYSDLPSLGHITGYIGKVTKEEKDEDNSLLSTGYIGKYGIEKIYDQILRGKTGIETIEIDSFGRALRSVGNVPAIPGESIYLSLDSSLQRQTALALAEAIKKMEATSGAAVALDPSNGEVLAMVSFPYYDINLFSPNNRSKNLQKVLTDPLAPLVNRAISGQYPSGSTIKPFVAAAALEEKVITETTRVDTSAGKISVGPWTFSDWKRHGVVDVRQAIAESNNIFFYTLGGGYGDIKGLGARKLTDYLQNFGLGKITGVDLTGEAKGNIPTPEWKKRVFNESWYVGDTYNTSIGQGGLLLTPLQLAVSTSSFANGGNIYKPHFLRKYVSSSGKISEYKPEIINSNVVSKHFTQVVREGMRRVVTGGSATRTFGNFKIEVAAKTGTAQFSASKKNTHSWITAFAPYDNPKIIVAVIVEGGGTGFTAAAPVAKNMLENFFKLPITPIIPQ